MTCSDVCSINLMIYVLCFVQGEDLEVTRVSAPELDKWIDVYGLTCFAVLSFHNLLNCLFFERKQVSCHPTFILLIL